MFSLPAKKTAAWEACRRGKTAGVSVSSPMAAGGSHVVGRFAVRADIEAFAFLLFGHAQPDDQIGDLECDQRDDCGPDNRDTDSLGLDQQLLDHARIAR